MDDKTRWDESSYLFTYHWAVFLMLQMYNDVFEEDTKTGMINQKTSLVTKCKRGKHEMISSRQEMSHGLITEVWCLMHWKREKAPKSFASCYREGLWFKYHRYLHSRHQTWIGLSREKKQKNTCTCDYWRMTFWVFSSSGMLRMHFFKPTRCVWYRWTEKHRPVKYQKLNVFVESWIWIVSLAF